MDVIKGIAGIMLGQAFVRNLGDHPYPLDIINNYVTFHEDLTSTIDAMIMDPERGVPGPVTVISNSGSVPVNGPHYYYLRSVKESQDALRQLYSGWLDIFSPIPMFYSTDHLCDPYYVGLYKKVELYGNQPNRTYYIGWTTPHPRIPKGQILNLFRQWLFALSRTSIVTYRIDATDFNVSLYSLVQKFYPDINHGQRIALDNIMFVYKSNDFTGTFLIYGPRGTRKSSTAISVKRALEEEYPESSVTLINGFDPSQTGVDICKLVLRNVSKLNPHVIVIDEIDKFFEIAAADPTTEAALGDRRFRHTANVATFRLMLDTFALTRYLIVVGTSEKSPETLWHNPEYRSFMRTGRITGFVELTSPLYRHNTFNDD